LHSRSRLDTWRISHSQRENLLGADRLVHRLLLPNYSGWKGGHRPYSSRLRTWSFDVVCTFIDLVRDKFGVDEGSRRNAWRVVSVSKGVDDRVCG